MNIRNLKRLIREEYDRIMENEVYEIVESEYELDEVEFSGFEDKGCEWYEKSNPSGKFKKIGSHLKESDDEDSIYGEIESRMRPTDFSLGLRDIEEISQIYGVDEEEVLDVMNSYISDREKERQNELSYWVKVCIDEMREEGLEINYQTFKEYFDDNNYGEDMIWASDKNIMDEFRSQTEDPNQLKLDLKESIRSNSVLSEEIKRMKNIINY